MNPTRYPLHWPIGWKRTEPGQRTDAKFTRYDKRLSIWDGLQRVMAELGRMGVSEHDVVISSNVETRLDGLPRSDRAAPADVGVAVYWQRGGPQSGKPMQCMAIDIYTTVADNLAAIAASLDAMRAIKRHGGAQVMERAFTGFTALPAPTILGSKRDWWTVLECQPNASKEVIDHSYRRLASRHHPDRETGNDAKMAELNAAREEALKEVAHG